MRKKFTLILFASFVCTSLFAQTIIDYQAWSSSACNAFGSGVNVPGTTNGANISSLHQSAIGQPMYGSANKSIMLDCKTENSGTASKGTEYCLAYNFKANYTYKVTINASCVGGNSARLRLLQTNGGGSSVLCNGSGIIDPNASGNEYVSAVITSGTTWSDYTFTLPVYATQWAYLNVAAIPSANGNLQTINVRKITITETPTAFFTVSNIFVPCGSTTPQTFIVYNFNNSPGVTSYEWDLGANNGWLYNGSVAPQYISTTTNTITLTPSGNTVLQNVSVTVRMNQQDYKTYTATVTSTAPSYTISGPDNFCSSSTYQVTGLSSGSTVTWSASPSGVVNLNQVGNDVNVINVGGRNFNLIATVSSLCGVFNISKNDIQTGSIPVENISITLPRGVDPNNLQCFTIYQAKASIGSGGVASSYQWGISNEWSFSGTVGNGATVNFLPNPGVNTNGYITVKAQNACGWSAEQVLFMYGDCNNNTLNLMAYPNPATSSINIEGVAIQEDGNIELYNFESNKLSLSQKIKKGAKSAKIQVSHLPKGKYVLVIRDKKGKLIKTQQVILK